MTEDERRLFGAIKDDPEDMTLRLAYADAVQEGGRPKYAAFIRRHVTSPVAGDLPKLKAYARTKNGNYDHWGDFYWMAARIKGHWLPGEGVEAGRDLPKLWNPRWFVLFDRGIPAGWTISFYNWLENADHLIANYPTYRGVCVCDVEWEWCQSVLGHANANDELFDHDDSRETFLAAGRNLSVIALSRRWPGITFDVSLSPYWTDQFRD